MTFNKKIKIFCKDLSFSQTKELSITFIIERHSKCKMK